MKSIHDLIEMVRLEYLEMPGLRLTRAQVQRLCGIEAQVCQTVLDSLVGSKFLSVNQSGLYERFTDGHVPDDQRVASEEPTPLNQSDQRVSPPERRRGRPDTELRRHRQELEYRWNGVLQQQDTGTGQS